MEQPSTVAASICEEPAEFYDRLAADYDTMTEFEKRFVHEKPFFRMVVSKYDIKTALDAGAGTGFHSMLLAQLGVNVTAVDVSDKMLEHVKVHARQMQLKVDLVESDFLNLDSRLCKKFDSVFCLGNSLPHLNTHKELQRSLENFSLLLNPGGLLFIQMLNYDRIMGSKERVQSVKEVDGLTYVRFYEYGKDFVTFNILRLIKQPGGIVQNTQSVRLRPILRDELVQALQHAGFSDIQVYGSVAMDDFHEQTSKDLVILALKSQKKIEDKTFHG